MKSVEWKTYRTRFLVEAKQLSSSLTFVDHLGRQHCGRKGDYLVESFDGVLSIAPRQIFEDIYVPISANGRTDADNDRADDDRSENRPYHEQSETDPCDANAIATHGLGTAEFRAEAVKIERIKDANPRVAEQRRPSPDKLSRAARKSPQSVRATPSRLSLM